MYELMEELRQIKATIEAVRKTVDGIKISQAKGVRDIELLTAVIKMNDDLVLHL